MMTNPIFTYLFDRYKDLHEQGMDNTVEVRTLFMEMLHYAPPEYIAVADRIAKEMDLIPEPTGYLDDGTPMISLEALAKKLDPSIEEAEEEFERYMAMRREGIPVRFSLPTHWPACHTHS